MGQHKSKEASAKESKPVSKKIKKENKHKQIMSEEDIEAMNEYLEYQLEKNGFS